MLVLEIIVIHLKLYSLRVHLQFAEKLTLIVGIVSIKVRVINDAQVHLLDRVHIVVHSHPTWTVLEDDPLFSN